MAHITGRERFLLLVSGTGFIEIASQKHREL